MAVRPARNFREPKAIELLAFAYALGVAGTLWDWREHLLGPGTQPPHLVIDLGGLLVISALALLASWSAWRWLSQDRLNWWRLAAALGIVAVAIATVWDLYWHQTHPMELRTSMAGLPPHQAILAGFLIGLIGAGWGAALGIK